MQTADRDAAPYAMHTIHTHYCPWSSAVQVMKNRARQEEEIGADSGPGTPPPVETRPSRQTAMERSLLALDGVGGGGGGAHEGGGGGGGSNPVSIKPPGGEAVAPEASPPESPPASPQSPPAALANGHAAPDANHSGDLDSSGGGAGPAASAAVSTGGAPGDAGCAFGSEAGRAAGETAAPSGAAGSADGRTDGSEADSNEAGGSHDGGEAADEQPVLLRFGEGDGDPEARVAVEEAWAGTLEVSSCDPKAFLLG